VKEEVQEKVVRERSSLQAGSSFRAWIDRAEHDLLGTSITTPGKGLGEQQPASQALPAFFPFPPICIPVTRWMHSPWLPSNHD
jgi:hypothetical protein